MKTIALLLLVASSAAATTYFKDTFDSDPFKAGWTHSEWKSKSETGSFTVPKYGFMTLEAFQSGFD